MSELERSARNRVPEHEAPEFESWLRRGMAAGWCGPAVCATHDGVPSSEAEDNEAMDGWDPCIHVLRLYPDDITRKAVERDHPPSVWRRTNMA